MKTGATLIPSGLVLELYPENQTDVKHFTEMAMILNYRPNVISMQCLFEHSKVKKIRFIAKAKPYPFWEFPINSYIERKAVTNMVKDFDLNNPQKQLSFQFLENEDKIISGLIINLGAIQDGLPPTNN